MDAHAEREAGDSGSTAGSGSTVVDCDVHVTVGDPSEIVERLPRQFRQKGFRYPSSGAAPPEGAGGLRKDVEGEDAPVGVEPAVTVDRHLEELGVDYAVLNDVGQVAVHPNYRYAAALASAKNDWLVDTWLSFDDRFYGSVSVAPQHPEAAAEEIRRVGSHPKMVQVVMGASSELPYGNRKYWPIYEAAEEAGLPVAIHVIPGGGIEGPSSPAGYPSSYAERHLVHPNVYYGQLASMVFEGVFEAFPDLRFVMIEGGFGWVPNAMWRMDHYWRMLREEVPRLTRAPSEYVREHVRFTTQPVAEPKTVDHFRSLLEMMHADETLMYASDFPHWDGDYTPDAALRGVSGDTERAVFAGTAMETYDFHT